MRSSSTLIPLAQPAMGANRKGTVLSRSSWMLALAGQTSTAQTPIQKAAGSSILDGKVSQVSLKPHRSYRLGRQH